MKKFACIIVAIVLLPIVALADIDLSSMSYEELEELSQKVTTEMMSRSEWGGVKVPAGIWTVGVDIPEGEYSIRMCNEKQTGKVSVWGKEKDDYITNGGCVYPLVFGYDYTVFGKVVLKEGYIVDSNIDTFFCPPVKLGF